MVSIGIYTSVAIFYYHGYVEFVPYYTKIAEAKAQQAQLNLMPAVKSTQDLIAYDQRVVTKANTPLTIKLDGVGKRKFTYMLVKKMVKEEGSHELKPTPMHGELSGNPPVIVYTPTEPGFAGHDEICFRLVSANDKSEIATVGIDILLPESEDDKGDPVCGARVDDQDEILRDGHHVYGFKFITPYQKPIHILLPCKGDENVFIAEMPDHGKIMGTVPHIVYTPRDGFSGDDRLSCRRLGEDATQEIYIKVLKPGENLQFPTNVW